MESFHSTEDFLMVERDSLDFLKCPLKYYLLNGSLGKLKWFFYGYVVLLWNPPVEPLFLRV